MRPALDLNDFIVNPSKTEIITVKGLALANDRIYDGDMLLVDKALTPNHNSIVLARLDGDILVRRYKRLYNNSVTLESISTPFIKIQLEEGRVLQIIGVITYIIRKAR